jgi:hypothetical protein
MSNLASAVDEVLSTDFRALLDAAAADLLNEIARQRTRLDAAYLEMLSALDGRYTVDQCPRLTPTGPDRPTAPAPNPARRNELNRR